MGFFFVFSGRLLFLNGQRLPRFFVGLSSLIGFRSLSGGQCLRLGKLFRPLFGLLGRQDLGLLFRLQPSGLLSR